MHYVTYQWPGDSEKCLSRKATLCSDSASHSCCGLCVIFCEAAVPLEDEGVCLASDDTEEEAVGESMSEAGLKSKFQSLLNDTIEGRKIGDVSCSLLGCDKLSASAWECSAAADNASGLEGWSSGSKFGAGSRSWWSSDSGVPDSR